MFGKRILALIAMLIIGSDHPVKAEYDVNAYCTLVKSGTKLASIESCQTYYTCINGVAIKNSCASNQSFDKNKQICKLSPEVDCYVGNGNACAFRHGEFVADIGTCDGFIYCLNGTEAGRDRCGPGMIFSNGACLYGACNNEVIDGFKSICEIMPNNMYFGSTIDCLTWMKCTNMGTLTGMCPYNYVFNVEKGACDFWSQDICKRVTGIDIITGLEAPRKCVPEEEGQYNADYAHCNIYYICANSYWKKRICPDGLYYDIAKQMCIDRTKAITTNGCDRCFGTRAKFVNRPDPYCRAYSVCENGVATYNNTCPDGSIFDEDSQACLRGVSSFHSHDGPCYNPPSAGRVCVVNIYGDCVSGEGIIDSACGLNSVGECVDCWYGAQNSMCVECKDLCAEREPEECEFLDSCYCHLDGDTCVPLY